MDGDVKNSLSMALSEDVPGFALDSSGLEEITRGKFVNTDKAVDEHGNAHLVKTFKANAGEALLYTVQKAYEWRDQQKGLSPTKVQHVQHFGKRIAVAPWLEGETADQYFRTIKNTIKKLQDLRLFILSASQRLESLAVRGVSHRDIKGANLIVEEVNGRVQVALADIDLVYPLDERIKLNVGTVEYMAPEVFVTGKASSVSDMYSLGIYVGELIDPHLWTYIRLWPNQKISNSRDSNGRRVLEYRKYNPVSEQLRVDTLRQMQESFYDHFGPLALGIFEFIISATGPEAIRPQSYEDVQKLLSIEQPFQGPHAYVNLGEPTEGLPEESSKKIEAGAGETFILDDF